MSNVTFELEFDHAEYRETRTSPEITVYSGNIDYGYSSYVPVDYSGSLVKLFFKVDNTDIFSYKWKSFIINNLLSSIRWYGPSHSSDINNRFISYPLSVGPIKATISEQSTRAIAQKNVDTYDLHATYDLSTMQYRDDVVAVNRSDNEQYVTLNLAGQYNPNLPACSRTFLQNIENLTISIECEELNFLINNVYPIDVNCRNDRTINVTWEYINPRNSTYYYPTEAIATVTQGQTVKTFTTTESDIACPIPANELTPGEATYKVTLTSNYGYSYDSPEQTFTVIGQTLAPEITNITQDSFPTITWNCADQAAWELLIKNGDSVIYHSDMKVGTEQSYTLPVMLEDGTYSVEMRALNIYGYHTDWGSYGFVLFPTKPTAATNLIVSTNANYTVTIDCTAPEDAGTLYVVRRRTPNEKAIIIGEYNNGFTDYYVPVNTTYEYAVRNYVTGYADTDFIDATIKCPGVVIRDGEDLSRFIPLWKNDNEEFDVISNNSRSDTLVQCLGRKYPVNEIGEWLTSTRTFTAHVSSSDMLKLNDINLNSKCVYLQNKDECIPCKMEINDAGEYNGGGRIINFTLTRIDEEMA